MENREVGEHELGGGGGGVTVMELVVVVLGCWCEGGDVVVCFKFRGIFVNSIDGIFV